MIRRTTRMPENLHGRLERAASEKGISQNAFVIEACWHFIERKASAWNLEQERSERNDKTNNAPHPGELVRGGQAGCGV